MDIADEKILRRIPLEILGLALPGALIAWILTGDAVSGLFVLLGGGLAALGFVSLDTRIPEQVLEEIRGMEEILEAKEIVL